MADGHKGRTLQPSDTTRKIKYVSNRPIPDFITYLVGWSVVIDYQLVISLFQQLMGRNYELWNEPFFADVGTNPFFAGGNKSFFRGRE